MSTQTKHPVQSSSPNISCSSSCVVTGGGILRWMFIFMLHTTLCLGCVRLSVEHWPFSRLFLKYAKRNMPAQMNVITNIYLRFQWTFFPLRIQGRMSTWMWLGLDLSNRWRQLLCALYKRDFGHLIKNGFLSGALHSANLWKKILWWSLTSENCDNTR